MAGRRGRPFPKGNKLGKQFAPGKSGNPAGRPRTAAEVVLFARERSVRALQVLEAVMTGQKTPPATRVTAAQALLDRAWGRPQQAIVVPDDLSNLTDAELRAEIKRALKEDA